MAYTIILDAGHGGDDPGAVYNGRQEKDDNLELALAVGNILSENGINVLYTRTDDIYQTPFQKAQIANESGSDFFISFHRNSSPTPNQYSGVETLVYDKTGIKYEMALNINKALEEVGFKNLGVKARPGLVVLRRTNMPSLLIETGFINNDDDNALFDEKFQEIAHAIASAILDTLNVDEMMPPQQNMTDMMPPVQTPPMQQPGRPPVMPNEPEMPELLYRVQVGAFRNRENADKLLYELEEKGYPVFMLFEDGLYKIQVGAFRNLGNAIRMEQRLRQEGYTTWITT